MHAQKKALRRSPNDKLLRWGCLMGSTSTNVFLTKARKPAGVGSSGSITSSPSSPWVQRGWKSTHCHSLVPSLRRLGSQVDHPER